MQFERKRSSYFYSLCYFYVTIDFFIFYFLKLTPSQFFEEYRSSFIPDYDPRHQVVTLMVQHLAERNQDIEGMNSVPWTVHVIEEPTVNAMVMPVSDSRVSQ